MKGWAELKAAFWAVVDGEPAERRLAELAAIDPGLPARLQALLEADARGDTLDQYFDAKTPPPRRPTRIGNYEVVGVLGVGGMGEVYRARDARLQREVAIKVLPARLTTDPDRLARFEREAQVLAALKHRHIAHVYGLDETGGTLALVMEFVEGPTLAQAIADRDHTPIPVRRALTIARQIADGLDAAHEKGIVHRDLKPGNVALAHDDEVKILDFGLARSVASGGADAAAPPAATDLGVVLGTPAYMSPEQARGVVVDRRTDVWSFGCVLYELLTGRQAFAGLTTTDGLPAVLEGDANWSRLPVDTPPAVRTLLRQCLQKDPKRRLRDIADARLLLDDVLEGRADEPLLPPVPGAASTSEQPGRRMPALWLALAAGFGAAAMLIAAGLLRDPGPPSAERTITSIALPSGMSFAGSELEGRGSEQRFAVSPDGRKLALVAADESRRARLWLRDLASPALHPLPDTEGASSPFWSPDSASIAFIAAGKLRSIRVAGGTPMTVHDHGFRAGSWGGHGRILFAPTGTSGLHTVAATGGASIEATMLDTDEGEVQHSDPAFLPDGRHFLYFSIGSPSGALDPRGIYLSSLDAPGQATLLLPGATQPRYANGHVFFVQNGTLLAQAFDLGSRTLRGAQLPLVEEVTLATVGATGSTAAYSVSDTVLAYQAAVRTESRLVWVDRAGRPLTALTDAADFGDVALSPDGTRIAVSLRDPARFTRDLWLYDAEDGRGQRVTFDPGDEYAPVWSPDGTQLLFSAMVKGLVNLHIKDVGRTGDTVPVETDALGLGRYAADWSRDGRHLMYVAGGRAIARSDLWTAPVAKTGQAQALLESAFVETHGRFAPGGAWFLYTSNETGQMEVYVDRFPGRGAKRLVSRDGGGWPRWSRDGSEIFFLAPDDRMMAATVRLSSERIEITEPRALFAMRPRPPARLDAYPYDVSPDGQRFVVNTLVEDAAARTLTLVLEWAAGLKQ